MYISIHYEEADIMNGQGSICYKADELIIALPDHKQNKFRLIL